MKGFQTKAGKDWVVRYEKGNGPVKELPIKVVASENDLYPPEIEHHLNERYEKPANRVLEKLRRYELASKGDRLALVEYFLLMRERTPSKKQETSGKVNELIPERLKLIESERDAALAAHPEKKEVIGANFDRIKNYIDSDGAISEQIWLRLLQNMTFPRIFNALLAMNWCYVVNKSKDSFITCDAPFFFTSGIGLNKPSSEVFIPISARIALWLNWYPIKRHIIEARQSIINEINKRQVHNSTKYVFFSEEQAWLKNYCASNKLELRTLDLANLMRRKT